MARKIKWKLKNSCIISKDLRVKKKPNKEETYAVLQIAMDDDFSENSLEKGKKTQKKVCIITFEPHLVQGLQENETYTFSGTISPVYGGMYMRCERAIDEIGEVVGEGKSVGECGEEILNYADITVRDWNAKYPVGQKVVVMRGGSKNFESQTSGEATVVEGKAVVLVDGVDGWCELLDLYPLSKKEIKDHII